ncbi:exosortase-dependent surface protein XDP1 [Motiliproteus sediminis]|uniref:exosortase-dependent surface protein XDP1 n=1 Tax=Motiliproteus sediminis TaxID=1468178 RepID=UPI001AEF709D|nr:exosortase-dependent surface protein XDP1 [Motiliproteus sediminis]
MNKHHLHPLLPVYALTLSCLAGSAHAAMTTESWTWEFDDASRNGTTSALGETWNYSSDSFTNNSANLAVNAWSSTGDVSGPDTLETAQLGQWSGNGIGVLNRESDCHCLDGATTTSDAFENMDAVLLSFDQDVTLSEIRVGWIQSGYDADISLLAWNGAGAPSLFGETYPGLVGGSWDFLGHFYHSQDTTAVGGSDDQLYDFNSIADTGGVSTTSSSYYLLTVLNPELNVGNCDNPAEQLRYCSATAYSPNEKFKIWSISAQSNIPSTPTSEVPEPSSLWLLLAGLPLLHRLRRQAT